MPSSHTQLIFFQCTWALLVAQRLGQRRTPAGVLDALFVAAGFAVALLVAVSRVVLGYHTIEQVLVGAAAGIATAAAWFAMLLVLAQPVFGAVRKNAGVLQWLCDALQLHDSLARPAPPTKRH